MKKSQLVAFVYPDSVDVYRRIDHGDGHITYKPVPVTVMRPKPSWAGQMWSVVVAAANFGLSLLGG